MSRDKYQNPVIEASTVLGQVRALGWDVQGRVYHLLREGYKVYNCSQNGGLLGSGRVYPYREKGVTEFSTRILREPDTIAIMCDIPDVVSKISINPDDIEPFGRGVNVGVLEIETQKKVLLI
jgi:hypothetical protein